MLSLFLQIDFFQPRFFDMNIMSPLLYVHDLYSNMVKKMGPNVYSSSWSFYMDNAGNGKVVIMQSGPNFGMHLKQSLLTPLTIVWSCNL